MTGHRELGASVAPKIEPCGCGDRKPIMFDRFWVPLEGTMQKTKILVIAALSIILAACGGDTDSAKDAAKKAAATAADKADQAMSAASDAADKAMDAASDAADKAMDAASDAASSAGKAVKLSAR